MPEIINSAVDKLSQQALQQATQEEMPATKPLDQSQQAAVDQFDAQVNGLNNMQQSPGATAAGNVNATSQMDPSSGTNVNKVDYNEVLNRLSSVSPESGSHPKFTLGEAVLKSMDKSRIDFNTQKEKLQQHINEVIDKKKDVSQAELLSLQQDTMIYGLTAETLSKIANSLSSGVQQLTKGSG